ncbi:LOW QUALITY PROTEIN: proton-coupled folate transporter-like [Amphiura filiformis]|uniref:LOW QUALITY PROTEIN: proton-coupled folate transporter-like n=1 Tax=Amphiura filiformis TaxID=82378 RepID=UPI003B20CBE9
MSEINELPDFIVTSVNGNRRRAASRWITVEPVIFLAMIGYGTVGTTRTQYVRDRIAIDEYNYTFDDTNSSCNMNTSDHRYIIEQEIQSKAATLTMLLSLCTYIPPLFSAIVIGTWSDNHRRKAALFSPVLGMTIQAAIYLAIISQDLPLEVAFGAELAGGIMGGLPLLLSGCLSYIADVTDTKHRMIRIVVVEVSMLLAVGGSQVGFGFLIELMGFIPPFYIVLSCLILALLYITIPYVLIETIENHQYPILFVLKFRTYCARCTCCLRTTPIRRSRLIALGSIAFIQTLLISGYLNTVALFGLDEPFCWTPDILGVFMAVSLAAGGIGLAISAKLFSLCLSDFWIIHIGNISLLFTMLTVSLANTTSLIFVSSLGGCLRTLGAPVVRALMSKTVDETEQGVMFSFQTSAEGVAMFASPLILQSIYAATVEYDPHAAFYVASVICTLPIFLTIFLQYKSYMESNSYNKMNTPGDLAAKIGSINENL